MRHQRHYSVVVVLLASTLGACGSSGASNGSGGSKAPIVVAELFPMTGVHANVGQWFLQGATAGIDDVNANGGVMGRQLTATLGDTAGDPVDAVTAWHQLDLQQPAFEVGPASPDFEGVAKLYDPAHLVEFTEVGSDQYDQMPYAYVWRSTPSDSTQSVSMAYYATQQHYTTASFLFESTANKAGEVPALQAAFLRHGGKVLDTELIAPGQTSYRTEIEKAFATKPDALFIGFSIPTANTVFADLRQLGHLNVPLISDSGGSAAAFARAEGFSAAATNLTAVSGAPPEGPAWQQFLSVYKTAWHSDTPPALSQNIYDAVIVSALAMTAAQSADPKVWNSKITQVTNPPGELCYTYASCLQLLNSGKKINYEGATGSFDFNKFHNIFGSWVMGQWDSSGQIHSVLTVPQSAIATF